MTLAAKAPSRFKSVSAFAPICHPTRSDWGRKQFSAYLGSVDAGQKDDATALVRAGALQAPVLIDTGTADQFGDYLGTEHLAQALAEARLAATLRLQPGYDHSYFFVSSFMRDHIDFHADAFWG